MTVVAGKRQVTPSLVHIASFTERLSKLNVSGDRTKPFSSELAHERTAELATAAALVKSTLDGSVWRAYVTLSYKDVSRVSVLPLPASLNKSDSTQHITCSVRSTMTYSCPATTVAKRAYVTHVGTRLDPPPPPGIQPCHNT